MKQFNKLVLLTLISVFTYTSNAAAQTEVGQKDLSIGVGFGTTWIGSGYSTKYPTLSATYDWGLRDDYGPGVISVGGYLGVSGYSEEFDSTGHGKYGHNFTKVMLLGRAAYHYKFVDELDTYAGVGLGFSLESVNAYDWPSGLDDELNTNLGIVANVYVGAKYFLSENFAAFGELGFGISYMRLGVTLRL